MLLLVGSSFTNDMCFPRQILNSNICNTELRNLIALNAHVRRTCNSGLLHVPFRFTKYGQNETITGILNKAGIRQNDFDLLNA